MTNQGYICARCDWHLRGVWANDPKECPRCRRGDKIINPGAALAEPSTIAADLDGGDARPNSGLDSRDRGQSAETEQLTREDVAEHLYERFANPPAYPWSDKSEEGKNLWRRYADEVLALIHTAAGMFANVERAAE